MTDIDVNCPGLLTIRCRRRRTLKLTLKDQARTSATYTFTIYKDDGTTLYTEASTATTPKITVEGLNVVLKDYDFLPITGCYRYDFTRTVTNTEIKPMLEGAIIIMP